ncbi:hypothetical protein WCLP8_3850001 [uncultured Gammaproteobacteria bacterium]
MERQRVTTDRRWPSGSTTLGCHIVSAGVAAAASALLAQSFTQTAIIGRLIIPERV